MSVDCEKFETDLAAYVDRTLDSTASAAFEGHWQSCESCGALFSELFESGAGPEPLSAEQSEALWQHIEPALTPRAAPAPRRPARPRMRRMWFALAAAAVLLVALATWRLTREGPVEPQPGPGPEIVEGPKAPIEEDDSPAIVIEDIEIGDNYTFFINQPSADGGPVSIIVASLGD